MFKRTIFLICLVLLLPAIIFAGGKKEKETALKKMTLAQWEEWAQVGDYRTAVKYITNDRLIPGGTSPVPNGRAKL